VILLIGPLGSGKTRIAKGIISQVTNIPEDEIVSPTFTLIQRYEGRFVIDHADLYRIDSPTQALGVLEDSIDEQAALVVEWGEPALHAFADALVIRIEYAKAGESRLISLECPREGIWRPVVSEIPISRLTTEPCATSR
jgi:tRNA threonylcarbamoyladenosine biosynthesis protein TsaE